MRKVIQYFFELQERKILAKFSSTRKGMQIAAPADVRIDTVWSMAHGRNPISLSSLTNPDGGTEGMQFAFVLLKSVLENPRPAPIPEDRTAQQNPFPIFRMFAKALNPNNLTCMPRAAFCSMGHDGEINRRKS
jgi:hypothetical protein